MYILLASYICVMVAMYVVKIFLIYNHNLVLHTVYMYSTYTMTLLAVTQLSTEVCI